MLLGKLKAIPLHMQNIHTFPSNKFFKECKHPDLKDRQWLPKGHPAAKLVTQALQGFRDMKLKNIEMLTQNLTSTENEVLNRVHIKFRSKDHFFSHEDMVVGTYLTSLHTNYNAG